MCIRICDKKNSKKGAKYVYRVQIDSAQNFSCMRMCLELLLQVLKQRMYSFFVEVWAKTCLMENDARNESTKRAVAISSDQQRRAQTLNVCVGASMESISKPWHPKHFRVHDIVELKFHLDGPLALPRLLFQSQSLQIKFPHSLDSMHFNHLRF